MKKIKKWMYWNEEVIIQIVVALIICAVFGLIIYAVVYDSEHYCHEKSHMIIQVTGKDITSYTTYTTTNDGKTKVPQVHYQYWICWDESKIEVSKTVYDSFDIGYRFIINVDTKYEKDSGEIVERKYEYQN